MKIVIAIAAHKPYRMPESECYVPVQAGALGKETIPGYERDDTGENISEKNPYYSELTCMYWIWKNVEADAYGLAHYRRHFAGKKGEKKDPFSCVAERTDLESALEKADIVLPKKRRYYIETLYSHYAHTHYGEHLDLTREILMGQCPEYVTSYDKVMKRTWAHMFNMMVMKKERFDEYCNWLFPILFELEEKVDVSQYDAFQARLFGRVSELLLDVWLDKNNISYEELPVIAMEKMAWGRKIRSFLMSKLFGKKYKKSF